jgi:transposase
MFKRTSCNPEDFLMMRIMTIILILGLLSEIAVKPVAITRKNALFSDSVDGAVTSAIIFSIVSTTVANAIDPYKYLEYIFRQLPNLGFEEYPERLDEYLPWSEKMQTAFKVYDSSEEKIETGELENESA